MNHRTYRKRSALAADLGVGKRILETATRELKKYPERYPKAVIGSQHTVIIDREMFLDWLEYREALEARVPIPEFRRENYQ